MKTKTLVTALALALTPNLWAQTQANVVANELEISGLDDSQKYHLKLQLPNKQIKTLTLQPAEAIYFSSHDFALNEFSDGQYKYELTPISATKNIRQSNDKENTALTADKLSGSFTVLNGATPSDQDAPEDQASNDTALRAAPITGDLSVRSSLCVGGDCLDAEAFGFDTIRLKENNLRINFDDTSASASFAANDWEITINDSSNGGLNYFGITDVTAGRRPFTVEAGARANALYVDDGGRIGIGTSTPAVRVHIEDGNTPTVRLAQDATSGFAPQTWDVAGNEAGYFVRDATNGSTLPFRIRPGSPTSSIDIHPDGIEFLNNNAVINNEFRLGLGINSPNNNIHIFDASRNAGIILENGSTGTSWKFTNKSSFFEVSKSGTGSPEFAVYDTGAIKIGAGGATPNFDMDASGNVTIQGVLSQNSDVNSKENIELVNTAEVLSKVMDLPISVWNYKFDDASVKHLGPMAQDFFKQFNLGATDDKITTIDTSGVALASIKELGKQVSEKDQEIQSLKIQNEQLNQRLSALEAAIKSL